MHQRMRTSDDTQQQSQRSLILATTETNMRKRSRLTHGTPAAVATNVTSLHSQSNTRQLLADAHASATTQEPEY
ncbi:hypothetical protein CTRI78_v000011 [Colletotrichum trifolii]|uniref:Uncharacterized protein n=1 Tax=Colletotrichum trifolii TaxID=5466 RepID=A0A4R8RT27_COLTR|nr:hypothetical protein CTRI78_v000011 [Colletotrichum trifolii]